MRSAWEKPPPADVQTPLRGSQRTPDRDIAHASNIAISASVKPSDGPWYRGER